MLNTTLLSEKKEITSLEKATRRALQSSGVLLVSTVWISAGLFGLYILAFYAAALYEGNLERWNNILPGLYQAGSRVSTGSIGLHFATGGSIQLVESIRFRSRRLPLSPILNVATTLLLLFVITFLMVGTCYFTKIYWGPAIVDWLV